MGRYESAVGDLCDGGVRSHNPVLGSKEWQMLSHSSVSGFGEIPKYAQEFHVHYFCLDRHQMDGIESIDVIFLQQVNKLEITPDKHFLAAAGNPHIRLFDINSNNAQHVCFNGQPFIGHFQFFFVFCEPSDQYHILRRRSRSNISQDIFHFDISPESSPVLMFQLPIQVSLFLLLIFL